jgi:hypothetical protein
MYYIYVDTYPISDNESTTDSVYIIDTNTVKLQHDDEEQGELNRKSNTFIGFFLICSVK